MKRILGISIMLVCLAILSPALAVHFDEMDSEGVSIKAGPTDMTEDLAIAWLESVAYPKNAQAGKELFIEVKSTSKLKTVKAYFDFDKEPITLYSDDQQNWSRVYKIPNRVYEGAHVARLELMGENGKQIQRTLDFAVRGDAGYFADNGFPVSVLKSALVMDEKGNVIGQLLPGVKVRALYRAPFYRVVLEDGREGWVEGVKVEEPSEQLYIMGYKAFTSGDYLKAQECYRRVVELEPFNLKARFWLAKTYFKTGEEELAAKHLEYVLEHDPKNSEALALASELSHEYYAQAEDLEKKKDLAGAAEILKKAAALSPGSASTYMKIGDLYKKTGDQKAAKEFYLQALRIDPLSQAALSALNIKRAAYAGAPKRTEVAGSSRQAPALAQVRADEAPRAVPRMVATDSIHVVQGLKTQKGTSVSSAIDAVLKLTKSLGTKIHDDGWKVAAVQGGYLVTYACRQERAGKTENEDFTWKVDVDSRHAAALNDNAKLLMNRW